MAEIVRKERDDKDILLNLNLENKVEDTSPGERPCPACENGILEYDHFLNLICNKCGYVEASSFT